MCLAIPMTIRKVEGAYAVAEARGVETSVNCAMVPDITIGDKVLVHAGFIIEKLKAKDAKEIEATWEEYYKIIENEAEIKSV